MIRKPLFLFITILTLMAASCGPEEKSVSGQVEISSEFDFTHGTVLGFHFATQQHVVYPPNDDPAPDIVVDQFRMIDGTLEPGFTSPGNINGGFALVKNFSDITESKDYYDDYTAADTTMTFTVSSDTVRQYQVWLLKTSTGHYTKIHVRDVSMVEDVTGAYLNVFIDYYYQPDGTPLFP